MMKPIKVLAVAMSAVVMVAFAQDAEIVKVNGRGVGTDKTEALKDAYRDAVERAVGLYVDAEQMMKNEKLVKDQILTQSNAYIEKYEVAKETTKPNGLVEIQILAEVRKTALTRKISDVMPSKTFRLGGELQNAHAKISTTAKRNADGAALLADVLEGFDPFLASMECSLASSEVVIRDKRRANEQKNTVAANWLFRSGINQKRFMEMATSRLQGVLSQISLSAPRNVTLSVPPSSSVDIRSMIAGGVQNARNVRSGNGGRVCAKEPSLQVELQREDSASIFVLVINGNAFRTSYDAVVYELDKASAKVAAEWMRTLRTSPNFDVTLLDAQGGTVFSGRICPMGERRKSGSINLKPPARKRGERTGRRTNPQCVVLAPWLDVGGMNIEFECYSWQEIVLPENALPEVKDMKIEIVK